MFFNRDQLWGPQPAEIVSVLNKLFSGLGNHGQVMG